MFAESLLESNVHRGSHRRQLATALSISLQALALAALIAVSAFRPVEVLFATRTLPAPLLLPRVTPMVPEQVSRSASAEVSSARPYYVVPSPHAITFPGAKDQLMADPVPFSAGPFALPSNGSDRLAKALDVLGPVRPKGPDRPLVISKLNAGQLISRTEPRYPTIAKQAGIQGEVVLTAIISKSGRIESLKVKSGHPLLAQA